MNIDGNLIETYKSYKPFYMLMIILAFCALIIQIIRIIISQRKDIKYDKESCDNKIGL